MATVLVTGTNRGLGLEFARQYAARGDDVIAAARNAAKAAELNALARESAGRVTVHDVDVADKTSIDRLKRDVADEPLDILINNAGVLYRSDREPIDYGDWHNALLVNTLAPVYIASLFMENLRRGQARKLITITSHMGAFAQGGGGYLSYRASKAAVNRAMLALASDVRHDGIIVSLFHPGWVRTSMGGPSASLSPQQSVASLIRQIDALTPRQSGGFYNYNGGTIAW